MSKTPPTAGQTIYRLSVMVGTLSIGSMAAYLYGPPPEKLASIINTAANGLAEMAEHRTAEQRSSGSLADPSFDLAIAPNMAQSGSLLSSNVPMTPGSNAQDLAQLAASNIPQPITDSGLRRNDPAELLRQAGAIDSTITPWGSPNPSTGQSLYRAAATVPLAGAGSLVDTGQVTGGESGLVERLDAIGETPEAAVEALLAQMNRIRR